MHLTIDSPAARQPRATHAGPWSAPMVLAAVGLALQQLAAEAGPMLVGPSLGNLADVAQLAERDLAKVEATSSSLVIRSMSGALARKRRLPGVHAPGRDRVQRRRAQARRRVRA